VTVEIIIIIALCFLAGWFVMSRLIGIHRASARTAETMEAWFASTWEGQEYAARKRRAQVRQGAFCCS
jgi:hypothetical protein